MLIALTKGSVDGKEGDGKSIKYIMRYDGYYESPDESLEIWNRKWKYIIKGKGLQTVRPFNMEDVQKREKPYTYYGNYLNVAPEDEAAVLDWIFPAQGPQSVYPDELPDDSKEYREGKKKTVAVNVYERNPAARQMCIDRYGAICDVCTFNFGATYGANCDGMIHIHHLKMISETDGEYEVNPIKDLRPVCPNCHMVLHSKKDGCYSIEEVKEMLRANTPQ